MYLKKFSLSYFGPFYNEATLEVDENITVLTGSNDSGKTAILRAIEYSFSNKPITENQVNLDRIHTSSTNWRKDNEIKCQATFYVKEKAGIKINQIQLLHEDELSIFFQLAPELFRSSRRSILVRKNEKDKVFLNRQWPLPKIVNLNSVKKIDTIIDLNTNDNSEFLFLAFGANSSEKLKNLSTFTLRREIKKANEILNKKFSNLLPPSMEFKFELDNSATTPAKLILNIQDKFHGYTPFHLRGSGIKKIISIFSVLLKLDVEKESYIFLYDEPENSLHADAQHLLRSFLEKLSQKNNIQVIYATHSPSMINSLLPHTIRLVRREKSKDGIATSVIINKPCDDNFLPVRTSLGLTPVDSLLYSPITIIVEGNTELIAFPLIFSRIIKENFGETKNLEFILNQVRFLDGQGDSYEYWARLIKSQGFMPIIFIDGDKLNRIKQLKIREKMPDVPIVHFEEGKEIENIVPPEIYFKALSKLNNHQFNYNEFLQWVESQNFNEKMMFSKKIDKWISEKFPEYIYDKPRVMKIALQEAKLEDLDLTKIFKLVDTIKEQLKKISNYM